MTRPSVSVTCACGRVHTLDVAPDRGDERGALVVLGDGWGPVRGATLQRWARSGRLRAHVLERGRLAAWERDVRAAIEAAPCAAPEVSAGRTADVGDLRNDPTLEAAE